jgi:hypothetical protein
MKTKRLVVELDEATHYEFKVIAAMEKKTMTEKVVDYVQEELKKGKEVKK